MELREPGIKVGVSNRHIHLSRKDLDTLFGEGYELTPIKDLGQPGQYASEEVVTIEGPKGSMGRIRVLGPVRKDTQIEISKTDSFKLGVNPPVRDSGDVAGTPGLKVIGPKGEIELENGVIIAKRHIHMTPADAEKYSVKDKELVSVYCESDCRKTVFMDVLIRVSEKYALEFHADIDEANAALLKNNDKIFIVK